MLSRALDEDQEEGSLAPATCYLLSLSALEIFDNRQFKGRPNVTAEARKLRTEIKSLKKGNRLVLEDNSTANRKRFFDWFEDEFSRVYTIVENPS